jgi:UDPglucose--hexose-1-phosphate uridylyltransferase
LNPLTGRWVTVATGRASRPDEFVSDRLPVETDPARPCPFCPGHEEELPPALETYSESGEWLLRVVPNRYPAFEGTGSMLVDHVGPLWAKAAATGIHEVMVFSPSHDDTWADLDDDQIRLVMSALRDRLDEHAHSSGVRYSQAIVNQGRDAGASIAHPHGQLLGIPFVPGEIAEEINGFHRFSGHCLLCATIEAERSVGHRVVIDNDSVMVVAPWWSAMPFELLVIPTAHEGHMRKAMPDDLGGVGLGIRDALRRLREVVGETSYNIVVHTLPHHADDPFHWHVHVLPRLHSAGGFERGTGVPINIVSPEDVCDLLTKE